MPPNGDRLAIQFAMPSPRTAVPYSCALNDATAIPATGADTLWGRKSITTPKPK